MINPKSARAMLAWSALLVGALLAPAAAPPTTPLREVDQLDYVFFASDRPVLIRLHARLGDKPYDSAWSEWMDKLFAWCDVNNDGSLSPTETTRLPEINFLRNSLAGGISGGGGQATPFTNLDLNKDGKVDRDELRAYFKTQNLRPLQFTYANYQAMQAKQVNDTLYKRLDLDKDGKLTKDEMSRLAGLVRSLDENEDELLTASELTTESADPYGYVTRRPGGKMARTPIESGLMEVNKNEAMLATQLVTHYDRNKDGKLAKTEIALEAKVFEELDANRDGSLDLKEIQAFFSREPDLTFRIRLGQFNKVSGFLGALGLGGLSTPDRIDVNPKKSPSMPLAQRVQRVGGNDATFTLGDARFNLQVNEVPSNFVNARFSGARNFYLQQFDAIAGKEKYVTREQVKDNPYLGGLFIPADKDADGKLTRGELTNWLNLIAEGNGVNVSIQVNDHGRNLFSVMDANRDGSLSLREMRTSWERMKPLCKEARGLAVSDLPRTLVITAALGNDYSSRPFPGTVVSTIPGARMAPAPLWFRKMDRNNDGDLSEREWLGSEEDFKAADTDGDGLISVTEALRWEAAAAKGKGK